MNDTVSAGYNIECVNAVPKGFNLEQKIELCSEQVNGTGPLDCANWIIKSLSMHMYTYDELYTDTIKLCKGALGTGPAKCWVEVVRARKKRHYTMKGLHDERTSLCQDAENENPAKCYLNFLQTLRKSDFDKDVGLIYDVCRQSNPDIVAIINCLQRCPIQLKRHSPMQMCIKATHSNLPHIIECASSMVQKSPSIPYTFIFTMCSTAELGIAPNMCFATAQARLKWMTIESQAMLCQKAYLNSLESVKCASAMRYKFSSIAKNEDGLVGGGNRYSTRFKHLGLAQTCQRTQNATNIINCIKILPSGIFTAEDIKELCGASSVTDYHGSSVPAMCARGAVRVLLGNKDASNHNTSVVRLCQNATTTAPITCFIETQYISSLEFIEDRLLLCEQVSSESSVNCFKSIFTLVRTSIGSITDLIQLCRSGTSIAPANCLNELSLHTSREFLQENGVQLCREAVNIAPAECVKFTPVKFTDTQKAILCQGAINISPSLCAAIPIYRLQNLTDIATLCTKAISAAPAYCARDAPFGYTAKQLVALCQNATSNLPSTCAHSIPVYLKVPTAIITMLCANASSLTPAHCLAHRLQHHETLSDELIQSCRSAHSLPNSIKFFKVESICPILMPSCLITLVLHLHDQYGMDMSTLNHFPHNFTHRVMLDIKAVNIVDDIGYDIPFIGPTSAVINKGEVVFSNINFLQAGNFTLYFRSANLSEEVIRIRIYVDERKANIKRQCKSVFQRFQCLKSHDKENTNVILQLLTSNFADAKFCESHWKELFGGLKYSTSYSSYLLYSISEPVYALAIETIIPTINTSPWVILEIPENSTRAEIRRAYHQRALKWHPDKWRHGNLSTAVQQQVNNIYEMISHAYQTLLATTIVSQ